MKEKRKFTVIIEQDEEGYFVAKVPSLWACHSRDVLMKRGRQVIKLCLKASRIGG